MDKKTVYIIETHTGTIPAKVIKAVTKYQYSHVMISLDDTFSKMYSFGRRQVHNPLNGGFIIESKDGRFFNTFDKTECKIFKINVDDSKYNLLKECLNEYEKNPSKYNYDIIGLILRLFRIRIKRKNHYVCSQFVAEMIDKSSIYKFNKSIETIEPKDFEYIPNKEIIYIGRLKDYNL